MMSAKTGSYQIARPVIFLDFSIKVRQRSTATLPPAERRPRDVSPRSLARLNQSSGSFSGIPCGFAVLMPARLDDVCQNRLVPNCPARYFLIFRSRSDNGFATGGAEGARTLDILLAKQVL